MHNNYNIKHYLTHVIITKINYVNKINSFKV